MSCSRQLEKERDDLVRTKNNMSLDLERLLNQKEVRWFHFYWFLISLSVCCNLSNKYMCQSCIN